MVINVFIPKWGLRSLLITTEAIWFCSHAYPGEILLTLSGPKVSRGSGRYTGFVFRCFPTSSTPRFRAQTMNGNQCNVLRRVAVRSCEPVRVLLWKWHITCCSASKGHSGQISPAVSCDITFFSPSASYSHASSFTLPCFCRADKDRALRWASDRKRLNNITQVDAAKENYIFDQCCFL